MRTFLATAGITTAGLAALLLSFASGGQDSRWMDDIASATELASETGRPLLIVFR
jgi:hypothetical protein